MGKIFDRKFSLFRWEIDKKFTHQVVFPSGKIFGGWGIFFSKTLAKEGTKPSIPLLTTRLLVFHGT